MATWQGEVDNALILSGQAKTGTASDFNSDVMDKIQVQAKYAYRRAYLRIWREGRFRFLERQYTISAVANTSDYSVNSATIPELFVEDSFCISAPTASVKPRLYFMSYQDYQDGFPAGNGTGRSSPDYWVVLPPDGSGTDKIRLYPTPNDSYTVSYRAYLKPVTPTAATDTIVFPDDVKDILQEFAQVYIESLLSEGKAGDFASLLETALTAVKAIYRGPVEDKSRLNLRMRIDGRRIRNTWTRD